MIPEGLDKDILIENICLELAELSLIYSQPQTLQKMIGIWSRRRNFVWTELYKTLLYKYNPIENYNRTEERVSRLDHIGSHGTDNNFSENYEENRRGNEKNVFDGAVTDRWTDGGSGEETGTEHVDKKTDSNKDTTNTLKHGVYGFNEGEIIANSWQEDTTNNEVSEVTDVQNGNRNTNNSWNNSGNSNTDTNNTDTTDTTGNLTGERINTDKERHREDAIDVDRYKLRAYGNIGVTTTQQMIREQREIVQMDLFNIIVKEFKAQFCLMRW